MFVILNPGSNTNSTADYVVVEYASWMRYRNGDSASYDVDSRHRTFPEAVRAQNLRNTDTVPEDPPFVGWEHGDTVRISGAPGYETFTATYLNATQNYRGDWFVFVEDLAGEFYGFHVDYVSKEE